MHFCEREARAHKSERQTVTMEKLMAYDMEDNGRQTSRDE